MFSSTEVLKPLLIASIILTGLATIPCTAHNAPQTNDELSPLDRDAAKTLDTFVRSQLFELWNPLQMCIPLEENPKEYMDQIVLRLNARIQQGDEYADTLARGLAVVTQLKSLGATGERNPDDTTLLGLLDKSNIRESRESADRAAQVGTGNGSAVSRLIASALSTPEHKPIVRTGKTRIDWYRGGLVDVLELENTQSHKNANVVHSTKKVDLRGVGDRIRSALARMPKYERSLVVQASKLDDTAPKKGFELWKNLSEDLRKALKVVGSKSFNGLLFQIARFGVKVLDSLYMSPEFVTHIPVLGEKISELKKQGEPLIRLIQIVRCAHILYKMVKFTRERRSRIQNRLMDSNEIEDDREPMDLPNEGQVAEAKQILSEVGSKVLTSLASQLARKTLKRDLPLDSANELVSRSAFAVLTMVLPHSKSCL